MGEVELQQLRVAVGRRDVEARLSERVLSALHQYTLSSTCPARTETRQTDPTDFALLVPLVDEPFGDVVSVRGDGESERGLASGRVRIAQVGELLGEALEVGKGRGRDEEREAEALRCRQGRPSDHLGCRSLRSPRRVTAELEELIGSVSAA